jgi:hypothetical protein
MDVVSGNTQFFQQKGDTCLCRTKVLNCISSWVGRLFAEWYECVFCVRPLSQGTYQYVRLQKKR